MSFVNPFRIGVRVTIIEHGWNGIVERIDGGYYYIRIDSKRVIECYSNELKINGNT